MKSKVFIAAVALIFLSASGCTKEKSRKDRSEAADMYEQICRLTEQYTDLLESAPDSADWAALSAEFEEKLDKINFSFPPDTDLLLTEGQNDTILYLMKEYIKVRSERIDGILHPAPEADSLNVDSLSSGAAAAEEAVFD